MTDVFPLDKIYILWDKILTGNPSLPLFIGSAIVTQLRSEILNGDFPNRAAKLVKEFIKIHQDELLDMWETGVYKAIEGLN